jgi:hypothetical protein
VFRRFPVMTPREHTATHPVCTLRACGFFPPVTKKNPAEIPRVLAYGSSVTFFFFCIRENSFISYTQLKYTYRYWALHIYIYIYVTYCPVFLLTKRFLIYFVEHISSISRGRWIKKNYTHRSAMIRLTVWETNIHTDTQTHTHTHTHTCERLDSRDSSTALLSTEF